MNKALVEKLAVQSLVWVDTGLADGREQIFSTSVFAELIVEECRNVITEVYRNTPLELCGSLLTADEEIAKHFYGVEGMSTEDKKTLIKELLGVKE
jgi:hypothetical protein